MRLDNPIKRSAAILGAIVVGLFCVRLIISNFIVRVVTDPRTAPSHEALLAASSRFPDSPGVWLRLADTEIADAAGKGQFNANAEIHAARAVNLSPWDFRPRRLLAIAQDLNGKPAEAEGSLRAAVRLAPNHAEANWALANLLLRQGRLDESLGPFRVASMSSLDLLPPALDTIWLASDGNLETLKSFAGGETEAQLSVVKFLTDQRRVAEAVAIFNTIDKRARLDSPRSPELISALINAGQMELARTVWMETMAALSATLQPSDALIWNGGFEMEAVQNLDHFDWVIGQNKWARIGVDRNFGRSGERALKVAFTGLDTAQLKHEVKQTLSLKPGLRYRLECYAKPSDLITPEGPRVGIIGQSGAIALSAPVQPGSTDWQHLVVDFVAPADASSVFVAVVRIPQFSYDDPTGGVVWFDDFTLTVI